MRLDEQALQDFRILVMMVATQDQESMLEWLNYNIEHRPFYAVWIAALVSEMCDIAEIDATTRTAEHCEQAMMYLAEIMKK